MAQLLQGRDLFFSTLMKGKDTASKKNKLHGRDGCIEKKRIFAHFLK